jgi:hypothetical protein
MSPCGGGGQLMLMGIPEYSHHTLSHIEYIRDQNVDRRRGIVIHAGAILNTLI